ncbi:MAG: TolC family protein [Rhodoferax sp.]|nr:TolC family protein [Rhodoferax sp.]
MLFCLYFAPYSSPTFTRALRGMVLVIGLFFPIFGTAQTLGDAVQHAWSRQPLASALSAREGEAQARADLANGMLPAPASLSLSNVSDKLSTDTGKDAWELELAMPMWLPGQRGAREREAAAGLSEIDARRAALRLQIAGEVREAWWALANARQAARLAENREATAIALESDVLRRFKAGELARTDANLATNESLIAKSELLDAHTVLRQLDQAYRVLTGKDAPTHLVEESPPSSMEVPASHPQLSASLASSQLAHSRLNVAQESRREAPELAIKLVRERGDFGTPYANALGVKLTVPFSLGAKVRQETSAAHAEVLQADAELAIAKQRIELEVTRNKLDSEAARQQWINAQKRMELNADTLRLAEKMFALGESDLSALLRARASAFESEASFNRQRTAYFASISRLNQSLGVIP